MLMYMHFFSTVHQNDDAVNADGALGQMEKCQIVFFFYILNGFRILAT